MSDTIARNMSVRSLRNVMLLLTILAAAEAQENTFGIWTLNVAKSKLPDAIISGVKIEEPSGPNSVRDTVELRMADGRSNLSMNPSVRLDGTESTLEQTTIITDSSGKQKLVPYDGMLFRYERIDANNARYVVKRNGKIVQAGERILSTDGKTLTETHKHSDGRPDYAFVWERLRSPK